jgi:hypothetical protein
MRYNEFVKIFTVGFKIYKIVTIFLALGRHVIFTYKPELQMLTIDKEGLYKNLVDLLENLDGDKTYTALFIADSWSQIRVVGTLSDHSLLINLDFSLKVLSYIIEVDVNRFMSNYISNKYEKDVASKISVQYREWFDEVSYGKEKFLEIKKIINKNRLENLRKVTSLNSFVSDDVNIFLALGRLG